MKHVRAKKSLGQNFLRDSDIIEGILTVAELGSEDRVLEIGPGTGALTVHLLERAAAVTAVEIDHDMIVRLSETFSESRNLSLLEANILDIDLVSYFQKSGFEDGKYKIIANIPYYITAPIIRLLLSLPVRPERMVLMVQAEVADRLVAVPGDMSLLSLMAQYYADVSKELFVPRVAFLPEPKVDSAVIRLIPRRTYSQEADRILFRTARAGFAARRKTLANNLSSTFHIAKKDVEVMQATIGLGPLVRAQELSVEDWIGLSNMIEENRNKEV
jgi:16S rRNA (adenine1518-N6/adenine1519-N6)-dimethyltransferase